MLLHIKQNNNLYTNKLDVITQSTLFYSNKILFNLTKSACQKKTHKKTFS